MTGKSFSFNGMVLLLLSSACGEDAGARQAPVAAPPQELACSATQLERDATDTPIMGQAVDPSSGQLVLPADGRRYLVSTTYLALRADGQARFGQLMAPLIEQLPQQPGLLAAQFKLSESCRTARTFAVWESEEAMFAFVASPAHLAAMREQPMIATEASQTISFEAQAGEVNWERALREFESDAKMQ